LIVCSANIPSGEKMSAWVDRTPSILFVSWVDAGAYSKWPTWRWRKPSPCVLLRMRTGAKELEKQWRHMAEKQGIVQI